MCLGSLHTPSLCKCDEVFIVENHNYPPVSSLQEKSLSDRIKGIFARIRDWFRL